ncbi:MAG: ABC transporter permease subunit [Thermomicrobiales bacterium]
MSSIADSSTVSAVGPPLARADQQAADVRYGGVWLTGLVAALAWFAATAFIAWWPGQAMVADSTYLLRLTTIVALVLLGISLAGSRIPTVLNAIDQAGPWFIALAVGLILWEAVTAKFGLLPRPFFSAPQGILNVYFQDFPKLSESLLHSVRLLAIGFFVGAVTGFLTGIAIGWWKVAGYWLHPLLRFIGPLPATAWLPIAFFIFPTSFAASTFLVALASAVPVTILTWSGVAGVNKDYFDIARTMGASQNFLVWKVAVPAALPHVFVGLFMGLGASFAVLVVAEMLGVKAGLGWYLQWAQGWAAYDNMYAALLLMAFMCSSLVTLLFAVRDRTLSWQKELVRW